MSVITWTVAGGSMMFIIGLISAIESRRQHKAKSDDPLVKERSVIVLVSDGKAKQDAEPKSAMSMASGGTGNVSVNAFNGNAEENLASIGSRSR
jgi:hypothetical protein